MSMTQGQAGSWDPVWETIFQTGDWGRYPPEELIRFVARHYYGVAQRSAVRILELGCGTGANIWYLAREGFQAHGIDGAATAVAKARRRLAEDGLVAELRVGDALALAEYYPEASFDAVIDVGCLVCNRLPAVQAILEQSRRVLRPGGRMFSMTIAAGSWGEGLGTPVEPGTFSHIAAGPLRGRGLCHFFGLEEVEALFGPRFADVQIEYSIRSLANRRHELKHWVVEGVAR
jgi:SAM-dependent methyltransferase